MKVGDTVVSKRVFDWGNGMIAPIGTAGTIIEIHRYGKGVFEGKLLPFGIDCLFDGSKESYPCREDEIEILKEV